jgi:hypothetical protein
VAFRLAIILPGWGPHKNDSSEFRSWLKDEEDPAKAVQYKGWRELRESQVSEPN